MCRSIRRHCLLDPGHIVTDFGVHPRLFSQSTAMTPGHNSLELSITCHRAPGVSLKFKKKDNRLFFSSMYPLQPQNAHLKYEVILNVNIINFYLNSKKELIMLKYKFQLQLKEYFLPFSQKALTSWISCYCQNRAKVRPPVPAVYVTHQQRWNQRHHGRGDMKDSRMWVIDNPSHLWKHPPS